MVVTLKLDSTCKIVGAMQIDVFPVMCAFEKTLRYLCSRYLYYFSYNRLVGPNPKILKNESDPSQIIPYSPMTMIVMGMMLNIARTMVQMTKRIQFNNQYL